jgi:hypothetical protein
MDLQDIIQRFFYDIPPPPSYTKYGHLLEHNGLFGLLQPENDFEVDLLTRDEFITGLLWGMPRYGHPEGKVAYHIMEVYQNIDFLNISSEDRIVQRLIALVHDTFKYKEDRSTPRDWSKHHGVLARKFIEKDLVAPYIYNIIELHDEAFYAWRAEVIEKNMVESVRRLNRIDEALGDHLDKYLHFYMCDTLTGDKLRTPVKWVYDKAVELKWIDK